MSPTELRSQLSVDDQVNIDAPLFHVVPYVTGGFQRLLRLIKTDSVPDLPEYGYHTNSEGHFDPKGECVIGLRYKVEKILDAKGQSAVLVQAQDEFSHKSVVIKVLHTHFYQLGGQESHVLRKLAVADPLNISHTLRLLTTVAFDSHYCLVFEPLLPDPLTTVFSNIPSHRILTDVRRVGLRLLASVGFLHQQNFIHTDLKPDNILLKHENDLDSVHIVDFGNTINYVHSEVSLYYKDFELQTPLYRAPEVMYGVPFGPEIDIWSLGCILAELVIGKPLFLGTTKEEIMEQMNSLLGPFPAKIFRRGKYYKTFRRYTSEGDQANCTLKLMEHLQCKDIEFADLIARMLIYNPEERLTVSEAARHPFFASYLPLAFLLPSSTGGSPYPSLSLTKESYSDRPHIPSDIRRQPLSSLDLLRQGTTKLPNLEEPNVVKPLPRQGKYKETNSEKSAKKDEPVSTKGTNMPSNAQTDVSVFRHFIVDNKKRKYSKNVKDKMSSLLEAIRQEQDDVEEDLERRDRSAKSGRMRENESKGAVTTEHFRREVPLPRPCPRYGRFDVTEKAVANKTPRKMHSSNDFKMVPRGANHGKNSRHANFAEPSCSNQNFEHEQMGKMHQVTKKKRSVSEDDTRLSSRTEDTEVFDGSPTAHGFKVRPQRTQSAGFENFSVHEGNKVHRKRPSEVSFDREQHSISSGKSDINSSQRDNSFISGYEHNMSDCCSQDASDNNTQDVSESSDYSDDSDTDLSQIKIAYSRKPESRSEFSQFSDNSTKTREMNTLRGQIAEKRQETKIKYCRQNISNHSNSASNFKTYRDNQSDIEDGTSKTVAKSERGAEVEAHYVPQAMTIKKHSMDGRSLKGLMSPSFGSRKRLASESVSDNEEYVELLSPLIARSEKKKVRAADSGIFVTNAHSPYRRHDPQKRIKSDIAESPPETVNKIYKYDQETDVNRSGIHHSEGVSSKKDYRLNSLGTGNKFYEKEYEGQQTTFQNDDLTPSSRQRRVDRVDGARKFMDGELPSVTPIKREEKFSGIKDWISDSPEIVYKGKVLNTEYVKKEREKSSELPKTKLGEKGLNNFKDHCLQEHSRKRSLSSGESNKNTSSEVIYTKKIDRNRDLKTDNRSKPTRRNSFDHAEQTKMIPNTIGEVPYKMVDYSFIGTPDTDPKHLASRDGYAERIAQISRKRKKARKSLAFDSRRTTTVGYTEKDVNDEVNRNNGSSDSNRDEMMAEDYWGEMRAFHTSPNNLHNKFVNPSSIHRISNTQYNRRSLNDDLTENQKDNFRRKIDSDKDGTVHTQHVRKPVKCAKDVVAPKVQKDLKHVKKFDSTFTIDFESPLRGYQLNK